MENVVVETEGKLPEESKTSDWPVWWFLCPALFAAGIVYLAGWNHWPVQAANRATLPPVNIADKAIALKPGPWGNLESVPLYIEPPEEYLPVKSVEEAGRQWRFAGYSPQFLASLFDLADLTRAQQAELLDRSKWVQGGEAITITPSRELVLSLSPHARKLIYGVLSQMPGNAVCDNRVYFPADRFDQYFSQSGLSPETVSLVRKLSFRHGRLLFFCDIPLVLETLERYDDKVRFMKTIERKSTLLLRLHVMPDSDINSLANYWAKAAWGKDIKPMLDSLSKVPGGARVDVVHLLPPMPTQHLYTFPFPSVNPADLRKDCHWTALNFFRDPPDPRYTRVDAIAEAMRNDYTPVLADPRYGDLVQLKRANGDIIHSAIFVADNIVYTKNSAQFTEPFMLMTIADMLDTFSSLVPENETLSVMYYRSKYY